MPATGAVAVAAAAAPTIQAASADTGAGAAPAFALALRQFLTANIEAGETYVGLVVVKGVPSHHLILLAGDENKPWAEAMDWAAKLGGDLPTREEQSLLHACAKDQFKRDWYWSNTQHAAGADYAWCQVFSNGIQYGDVKSASLRARAVRRLPI